MCGICGNQQRPPIAERTHTQPVHWCLHHSVGLPLVTLNISLPFSEPIYPSKDVCAFFARKARAHNRYLNACLNEQRAFCTCEQQPSDNESERTQPAPPRRTPPHTYKVKDVVVVVVVVDACVFKPTNSITIITIGCTSVVRWQRNGCATLSIGFCIDIVQDCRETHAQSLCV